MKDKVLSIAESISDKIVSHRRKIHSFAEVGFETSKTSKYIFDTLTELGLECSFIGKNGVIANIKGKSGGKTIMLRADIDALPIEEKSGVPFSNKEGHMHACGHDMHTAMLLGAAEILVNMKDDISCSIKLLFQPAEEIISGAKSMIEEGVLENPKVDAAMTLHVLTSDIIEVGSVIMTKANPSAPSADFFEITIKGEGCHGSSPHTGIDPIPAACRIVTALDEIKTRELGIHEKLTLTIGSIICGDSANVIPEKAVIRGTMRGFYSEKVRGYIKSRMNDIINGISEAFRCGRSLEFTSGCPALLLDETLMARMGGNLRELLGENKVLEVTPSNDTVQGSEDFAYFSVKVPSVTLGISAGCGSSTGECIQLHNERLILDERCLSTGSAIFAYNALKLL